MKKITAVMAIASLSTINSNSISQESQQMNINQDAPVIQKNQIFINAPNGKVWKVLTSINEWSNWNSLISKAQLESNLSKGSAFKWKIKGAKINSIIQSCNENEIFGWTGKTFGGTAIHIWNLEKSENGTVVKVSESVEGWLVKLFKDKMNKDLINDMALWLDELKTECER